MGVALSSPVDTQLQSKSNKQRQKKNEELWSDINFNSTDAFLTIINGVVPSDAKKVKNRKKTVKVSRDQSVDIEIPAVVWDSKHNLGYVFIFEDGTVMSVAEYESHLKSLGMTGFNSDTIDNKNADGVNYEMYACINSTNLLNASIEWTMAIGDLQKCERQLSERRHVIIQSLSLSDSNADVREVLKRDTEIRKLLKQKVTITKRKDLHERKVNMFFNEIEDIKLMKDQISYLRDYKKLNAERKPMIEWHKKQLAEIDVEEAERIVKETHLLRDYAGDIIDKVNSQEEFYDDFNLDDALDEFLAEEDPSLQESNAAVEALVAEELARKELASKFPKTPSKLGKTSSSRVAVAEGGGEDSSSKLNQYPEEQTIVEDADYSSGEEKNP